jgi:hypothetical protein
MSGYSTTDLGLVNARLRALKRRGVARAAPISESVLSTPSRIEADEVARLADRVAKNGANGATSDKRLAPPASPADGQGQARAAEPAAGTRSHERRWRDASIILVERRRGDLYKYGSVAVCAALWAQVFWMFRT